MKGSSLLGMLAGVFLLGLAGTAHAALLTDTLGDKDCFGLGGSCPDGTLWQDDLGGTFGANYSTPADPSFTDRWFSASNIAYSHAIALGGAAVLSVELEIKTAGLADNRGPWDVLVNGVKVGEFATNTSTNAFQEVITHLFSIPEALLDGTEDILLAINDSSVTDGYSIDYSELRVTTADQVPEPGSLALILSAIAGIGALARTRRRHARTERHA